MFQLKLRSSFVSLLVVAEETFSAGPPRAFCASKVDADNSRSRPHIFFEAPKSHLKYIYWIPCWKMWEFTWLTLPVWTVVILTKHHFLQL